MSCAGCDDCPDGHWHLHVTVERRDGMPGYISKTGYELDMRRLELRPTTVLNIMRDESQNYREHIPTRHFAGSEAKATALLFDTAIDLARLGYWPKRLKIEGDARMPIRIGRALYYEAHAKVPMTPQRALELIDNLPISVTKKHVVATIRGHSVGEVMNILTDASAMLGIDPRNARVEACVLDTAPELDDAWMRGE